MSCSRPDLAEVHVKWPVCLNRSDVYKKKSCETIHTSEKVALKVCEATFFIAEFMNRTLDEVPLWTESKR